MRVGELGNLHDSVAIRIVITACYVLRDRSREQQIGLHNVADLRAIIFLVNQGQIVIVNGDDALGRHIEADQQLCQRSLPRTALADNCY